MEPNKDFSFSLSGQKGINKNCNTAQNILNFNLNNINNLDNSQNNQYNYNNSNININMLNMNNDNIKEPFQYMDITYNNNNNNNNNKTSSSSSLEGYSYSNDKKRKNVSIYMNNTLKPNNNNNDNSNNYTNNNNNFNYFSNNSQSSSSTSSSSFTNFNTTVYPNTEYPKHKKIKTNIKNYQPSSSYSSFNNSIPNMELNLNNMSQSQSRSPLLPLTPTRTPNTSQESLSKPILPPFNNLIKEKNNTGYSYQMMNNGIKLLAPNEMLNIQSDIKLQNIMMDPAKNCGAFQVTQIPKKKENINRDEKSKIFSEISYNITEGDILPSYTNKGKNNYEENIELGSKRDYSSMLSNSFSYPLSYTNGYEYNNQIKKLKNDSNNKNVNISPLKKSYTFHEFNYKDYNSSGTSEAYNFNNNNIKSNNSSITTPPNTSNIANNTSITTPPTTANLANINVYKNNKILSLEQKVESIYYPLKYSEGSCSYNETPKQSQYVKKNPTNFQLENLISCSTSSMSLSPSPSPSPSPSSPYSISSSPSPFLKYNNTNSKGKVNTASSYKVPTPNHFDSPSLKKQYSNPTITLNNINTITNKDTSSSYKLDLPPKNILTNLFDKKGNDTIHPNILFQTNSLSKPNDRSLKAPIKTTPVMTSPFLNATFSTSNSSSSSSSSSSYSKINTKTKPLPMSSSSLTNNSNSHIPSPLSKMDILFSSMLMSTTPAVTPISKSTLSIPTSSITPDPIIPTIPTIPTTLIPPSILNESSSSSSSSSRSSKKNDNQPMNQNLNVSQNNKMEDKDNGGINYKFMISPMIQNNDIHQSSRIIKSNPSSSRNPYPSSSSSSSTYSSPPIRLPPNHPYYRTSASMPLPLSLPLPAISSSVPYKSKNYQPRRPFIEIIDLTKSEFYLNMMSKETGENTGGWVWNPNLLSKYNFVPLDNIDIPSVSVKVDDIVLTEDDLKLI